MSRHWWFPPLTALVILSGACASDGGKDSATTEQMATTQASQTSATDTSGGSSTATSEVGFTVTDLGRVPSQALGTTSALGSGCAPGTDLLPDGAWFGWVTDAGPEQIAFDLACLWPGRLEPAASNDASAIRRIPVSSAAEVYHDDGNGIPYTEWIGSSIETPAVNAPGLPPALPFWLFVNDGAITEISQHPERIGWARSATAWPAMGPGCCDAGTIAPPSPAGPWPRDGWPTDGFYAIIEEVETDGGYDLSIGKWLSCKDAPTICPDWWTGDEVVVDPDQQSLERRFSFDETTMVVVTPFFAEGSIVSDGTAFAETLADLHQAIADYARGDGYLYPDDLSDRTNDPAFPFGAPVWPDGAGRGPLGYRGPGGSYLTNPPSGWWMALEIRDGRPVLYIHAGLIAG